MDDLRRRVQRYYASDPEGFDAFWAPVLRSISTDLLPHLPLERVDRILEIGCGTGGLLADLRAAAPTAAVFGADLTEAMLLVARGKLALPLAAMAAEELALRDRCVDAAVFAFVLHRVGQPLAALREAARVLRPGGAVGVVTWGRAQASPAGRVWEEEIAGLGRPQEAPPRPSHGELDAPEKLERQLGRAGFASALAWRRTFEQALDREQWLQRQVALSGRCQLADLTTLEWRDLVARVDARVQALEPDAFVYRTEAVYGVGYTAPASP